MNLGEYVSTQAVRIARGALSGIESGDIESYGELNEYVTSQLGDVMDTVSNIFSGEAISNLTQPAVQKAIDTIKPAVLEALRDYTPTFAAVSGGMLALAVLLGVWVSNETSARTRRRAGR
jgi:hypothetical protein